MATKFSQPMSSVLVSTWQTSTSASNLGATACMAACLATKPNLPSLFTLRTPKPHVTDFFCEIVYVTCTSTQRYRNTNETRVPQMTCCRTESLRAFKAFLCCRLFRKAQTLDPLLYCYNWRKQPNTTSHLWKRKMYHIVNDRVHTKMLLMLLMLLLLHFFFVIVYTS